MNVYESVQLALKCFREGDLSRAEFIFREILKDQPHNAEVSFYLGIILHGKKQLDEAIVWYQKTLKLDPNLADAYHFLGIAFQENRKLEEAIECYLRALKLNPNLAEAYFNLGNAFNEREQLEEAVTYYRKALEMNPNLAEAYFNLGNVLKKQYKLDDAIEAYNRTLTLRPDFFKALNNLGNVLKAQGKIREAIGKYECAIAINPDYDDVYNNLGMALQELGKWDEAIENHKRTLAINPNHAESFCNLGNVYKIQGKINEAEQCYRRALQIKKDYASCFSNLLLLMNYSVGYNAKDIFTEHRSFSKLYEEPLSSFILPHFHERIASRRLRIGYISPDFKRHSVAYFIEPVLAAHLKEHFEVFCYSDVIIEDEITKRLRRYADKWRSIIGMTDDKASELIRKDGIDILVDLAGHTAHNRMLVFARKPAPVQVSWIGYPATTGLSTMDYKVVDNHTDPPGMTDQFYTEKLIRMPESFLCYLPDSDSPEVGNLPALTSKYITFGSFNNFTKVSREVLTLWTEILKSIPDSHLLIKAYNLSDMPTHQYAVNMFTERGLSADRIELLPGEPSYQKHLDTYNRIDIGLDTYPYHGTTTTCEAIWMGVPVITLAGNTHVSRVGVSLLSNVGLADLIAKTNEQYIDIAVNLANDLNRLKSLRESLRGMISASSLTDAKRFTINLENCYRIIWKNWYKCD